MNHDSMRHRHRSIRLKDFDYSQPGAYFVIFLGVALNAVIVLFYKG